MTSEPIGMLCSAMAAAFMHTRLRVCVCVRAHTCMCVEGEGVGGAPISSVLSVLYALWTIDVCQV